MKLKDFFEKALATGRAHDPRGPEGLRDYLAREREVYDALGDAEKQEFDVERLTNPYHDSRILYGADDLDVKVLLAGVDVEIGEILLADRLRERGRRIDMCFAHHPEGFAQANLYRVMEMQADMMARFGIPINVAEGILDPRIHEVRRRLLSANHTRAVDAAQLLGMPLICIHTPADNCVNDFLQTKMDAAQPQSVKQVVDILKDVPEYREQKLHNTGLIVLNKSIKSEGNLARIRAGRVFVDMTGGTGGSKWMFEKMALNTQIGTFVSMHISDDNLEIAKTNHINVIVAGHTASDTLGLNLLLDAITEGEEIEVIPCSGFRRISHRA